MTQPVLGIDLGTSAVKCVLCRDGVILASGTGALNVSSPQPGWSEQDPADWCRAVAVALAELASTTPVPLDTVCGIGLSGQMHGAVTLDTAGHVLRPAILWNDSRSVPQSKALAQALPQIGQIAGVPPLPGFTAPKLMWMRAHEPDLFTQIATILLPKDYIGFWLTGARATDVSDAAGTLWLDQRNREWGDDLIAASGIERDWLPPLHHGHEPVGALGTKIAGTLGLRAGIPVFAGGGDAAAGALSLGGAKAGDCFISLGTSGQLLVVDQDYQPNPDQYVHAYCHTVPDLWYRMAAMLNGARPLSWFASVLELSVAEMLAQAARADVRRVPLFLPYLTGERSPHGDPDVRAAFYDLHDATGRPEMCRAVVEAVAFMMRDAVDSFGKGFAPAGAIPVIGGGSRSDLVLQTLSNVLGRPLARSSSGEGGAAYGAALLAEVGSGQRSLAALSFAPDLTTAFAPEDAADTLGRLSRYRTLYQALKGGL